MPQPTFPRPRPLAAALLASCALLAGCALVGGDSGPVKSKVTEGIAYDCGGEGKAYVRFGDGGYLPGETALARDNVHDPASTPQQRARTTATLTFGDMKYDLVPEATQGGLRYRSDKQYLDRGYLIWSQGSAPDEELAERWNSPGRPLTSEDARVGLRASMGPMDEDMVGGEPFATCRRLGRDPDAAEHHAPDLNASQDHAPAKGHEEPHAR
jgi:hypothetical protein